MAEHVTETPMLCPFCGEEMDDEEVANPRRIAEEPVCDDCYREQEQYVCCWCEYDEDNEHQHTYLVVTEPQEVGLRLPGLYRIDRYPYYWSAMLYGGINTWAVTWLGYLPDTVNEAGYPCGYLCRYCQHRALRQIAQTADCGIVATRGWTHA